MRLLLKYFKRKSHEKVKPIILTNHNYIIKNILYNFYDNDIWYFDGSEFTSRLNNAREYRDIEALKTALEHARRLAIAEELLRINLLKKEEHKFKEQYKRELYRS